MVQAYSQVCPVPSDKQDSDWEYIVFEFAMNFTLDGVRAAYQKQKEQEANYVDDETLRKLGYSEEAIMNRIDRN